MIYILGIFIFVNIIFIIFNNAKNVETSFSKSILSMRKLQSNSFRQNALKKKFEKLAEENTKISTKYKVETKILQAGFDLSYGEYKLISIASAIILPLVVVLTTNNQILSIMCIFLGYNIPSQVFTFIKNRRCQLIDGQVGTFIKLTSERYSMQGNFAKAVEDCLDDFKGQEPLYHEIKITIAELKSGVLVEDALYNLARRTNNKYLKRYADYYKVTSDLGTSEAKEVILSQAYQQYDEHRKMTSQLKKNISEPIGEAYFMLGSIPVMILYQIAVSNNYLDFMLNNSVGKIGSAFIVGGIALCIWFVNAKIASPLE